MADTAKDSRYPKAFEIRSILDEFVEQTEVAVVEDLNVAYRGGNPSEELDVREVVIDKLESRASQLKKDFKPKRQRPKNDKLKAEPLLDDVGEKASLEDPTQDL